MFNDRRIESRYLHIRLRKNIPVFLKESFVRSGFFKGACNANGYFFYNSRFNGNVDFYGGGDVGHVVIFKIIWDKDRVIELVYMP
jgi:hypothetical protein